MRWKVLYHGGGGGGGKGGGGVLKINKVWFFFEANVNLGFYKE